MDNTTLDEKTKEEFEGLRDSLIVLQDEISNITGKCEYLERKWKEYWEKKFDKIIYNQDRNLWEVYRNNMLIGSDKELLDALDKV